MCDYGQGGVTDVPAQLRTSVRREEAEGVTHWKSGAGGGSVNPKPLLSGAHLSRLLEPRLGGDVVFS